MICIIGVHDFGTMRIPMIIGKSRVLENHGVPMENHGTQKIGSTWFIYIFVFGS